MTEKIKSAIEALKTMYPKKCKMVDGRLTGGYDDYESEKGKSITLAIRSLKAWEEVLQELEEKKDVEKLVPIGNTAMVKDYKYDESTICMAIDIINQKLAEIEE